MVRAIEDGYLQGLIADEAFKIHQEVESGERPVVGVNRFVVRRAATRTAEPTNSTPRAATFSSSGWPRSRPSATPRRWRQRCAALSRAAEGDDNLMHQLIDCANAYCTVGEMVSALKAVWGEFQQPVVF